MASKARAAKSAPRPRAGEGAQSVRRALAVLRLVATGQDRGVRLTDTRTEFTEAGGGRLPARLGD